MDRQGKSAMALATCRLFAEELRVGNKDKAVEAFWTASTHLWKGTEFYWNEWSDQMVKDIVGYRRYAILGAKQSGKSTTVMAVALVLYWGAWKKCSVIYRTTTLDAAEQRGWGEFVRLMEYAKSHLDLPGVYQRAKPPRFIPSSDSGDKKNAILCMPTKAQSEGSNKTAQSGIKGFHTEFQLLIDDELNEMPDGVEQAPAALDAEWKVFRYIGIGNPNDWTNPLGKMSMPIKFKRTALYEKNAPNRWEVSGGMAIRLNAFESPNIIKGKKPDGTWPYKHLPTPITIDIQREQCGYDDNHALMWQFIRALPPPDDATAAVLTHTLVAQHKADQPADFAGRPMMVAGLDPAFTSAGDDCILRFARVGQCRDGRWRIEFLESITIPIASEEEQDSFYRIYLKVREACENRGVQPWNFAFDCSGTGLGIKSVFTKEWDRRVHPCDALGAASGLMVTAHPSAKDVQDKKTLGKHCFDRRVSEIYFTLRYFVENDQVRGLYGENEIIVNEGSQRKYFSENGKLSVISKRATYQMHYSSDNLDAACVICDLLKHKGFLPGGKMADAMSIQEQAEDVIHDRTAEIPAMAGPEDETTRVMRQHLNAAIAGNTMFSQTDVEQDYAFDESGIAGF